MKLKIQQAFDTTDSPYMKASLKQRNPGPGSAGSTFDHQTTFEDLKFADWQPSNDPAITAPGEGYTCSFGGLLGITKLESLPQNKTVVLQPAHGGKAKIRAGEFQGQCPAECASILTDDQRMKVDFTTLIIGPDHADPTKNVVWTFFPGPATFQFKEIPFESLKASYGVTEDRIEVTVATAIELGYKFCKHVPTL